MMQSGRIAAVAYVVVALLSLAAACEPEGMPQPAGTTDPVPAATRAAQLLDQVATGDPATVFERRYVVYLGGGSALFIGTRSDTAIAYYCDAAGSAWLGGSNDFGQLQLVASSGVGFVGGVVAGRVEGRLSGTKAHDGAVALAATTDTVLERNGASGRITGPRGSCQ